MERSTQRIVSACQRTVGSNPTPASFYFVESNMSLSEEKLDAINLAGRLDRPTFVALVRDLRAARAANEQWGDVVNEYAAKNRELTRELERRESFHEDRHRTVVRMYEAVRAENEELRAALLAASEK